jgi:hypothetical protein
MQAAGHSRFRTVMRRSLATGMAIVSVLGTATIAGAHTPAASNATKAAAKTAKRVAKDLSRDGTVIQAVKVSSCKRSGAHARKCTVTLTGSKLVAGRGRPLSCRATVSASQIKSARIRSKLVGRPKCSLGPVTPPGPGTPVVEVPQTPAPQKPTDTRPEPPVVDPPPGPSGPGTPPDIPPPTF